MASISTDTSAKDFDSIIDSLIAFASIKYGSQTSANRVWSDFNASSFSRNWAELVAYVGDQLMFYMDTQSNQAYLRTATIPSFVLDIAQQLGYEVPTQQAASGKLQFTFTGPATIQKFYQVTSQNIPFFTTREITSNQSGDVEVEAIQGLRFSEAFTAEGIQNEQFIIQETDIVIDLTNPNPELRSPIVSVNGTTYDVVTTSVDAAPNSTVVIRRELPDGRTSLTFGDGVFGRRLVENESVTITYRTEGGTQGNVQAGAIDTLGATVTNVSAVTNTEPFTGGVDRLTLQQIKDRVPLSLKTKAGAVSLTDFADILIANFPQVLTAKAALNTIDAGIDLNIYVVPQAEGVTNITDNQILYDTLTDYVERRKVVGTQFTIKDGESINMSIDLEVYVNSDASRAAVESDIRDTVSSLFDLNTGGADGSGVDFQEVVRVSSLFDAVKNINGVDRFEIKRHTIIPRVEASVASPNQDFYISKVDVYSNVGVNEWLIATAELSTPEPASGQITYRVFKRTRGNVTSLNADSVTDSNLDLTEVEGTAIVINDTLLTDPDNVFTLNQYDDYLVVDSANNIWQIQETRASSLVITSPALTDASVTTVANGAYRIVKSFSGEVIGIGGENFSILYNNRNTFFSQGASFNLIATVRSPFILSEEQSNQGTYGVPVSISAVTPEGPDAGDLVEVEFNGNPNLQAVDISYNLVDSLDQVFEVASIADNDSPIASYNNPALIDAGITLTDTGADQSVSIAFVAEKEVSNALIEASVSLEKSSSPLGNILVEIWSDNSGSPDTAIATSNVVPTTSIAEASSVISFNFPTAVSLTEGEIYHLVVTGDGNYKTSYDAGDGEVRVGVDTTTLAYSPASTASGSIRINSTGVAVLSQAEGTVTLDNNFIRTTQQASLLVTLSNNGDFLTGTNKITIAGQDFLAVSAPAGPSGEFEVGASLEDTRDDLLAKINAQMTGIVSASPISTDALILTADATDYKGELGNAITVTITDAGVQNFDTNGLTNLVGGIDGDKVIVTAPTFLNSTTVGYTYDSDTGVITFSSAVSLPSFLEGDLFRDGAGTEFSILAVDDGSDTVTIGTEETVDNTVEDQLSGSIFRPYTYEYGNNVALGANITDSASNLATEIDSQTYVSASSSVGVVTLTSDILGDIGNNYRLEVNDLGQNNFTLSGTTLEGGVDGDIVSVNGVELTPVSGSPTTGQFEVDLGSLPNTLANLEQAIDTHPSLTGIVVAATNVASREVVVSAATAGSAGNSITLSLVNDSSGEITVSGSTLEGGEDNKRVQSYNGVAWSDYATDADMIFFIGVSSDSLFVVSKSDENGNQIIPQLSVGGNFDAGLGKRYYSDDREVSFTITTRSANSFILGGEQVNIFGEGIVAGEAGVRVDQFVFRTSKIDDDVTNLRENEIPVLTQTNLKPNLLGGVN